METCRLSLRMPRPTWIPLTTILVACTIGCGSPTTPPSSGQLPLNASGAVNVLQSDVALKQNLRRDIGENEADETPDSDAAPLERPALEKLTVPELIDMFEKESRRTDPAYIDPTSAGFAPSYDRIIMLAVRGPDGNTEDRVATVSPVMREIVGRGVAAIPDLLQHVSDERPTKLRIEHSGGFGSMWFSDEYDPRYFDTAKQPLGVRTGLHEDSGFEKARIGKRFTFHVGDLCYVAIGEIVGRSLHASHYQPSGCTVVNSPIQNPALAAAVRSDWTELTVDEHRQSLVNDALSTDNFRIVRAIERLFFYYPDDAEAIALKLLARPISVSPHRKRGSSPDQPSFGDSVSPTNLNQLIHAVGQYSTDDMREQIYRIYRGVLELSAGLRMNRAEWDSTAVACMYALTGKGHDEEFSAYVKKRLKELRTGPADQFHPSSVQAFQEFQKYLQRSGKLEGPEGA